MFFSRKKITEKTILAALTSVAENNSNVVDLGMISAIHIKPEGISFIITVNAEEAHSKQYLQAACEEAVRQLTGIKQVTAIMTAEKKMPTPPLEKTPLKKAVWNHQPLAGVKQIIAVSSGKGGVGKSTTAVNLAYAWMKAGKKVGLLDADIYGPSLPRMLGVNATPEVVEGKIIPLVAHTIKVMSIGFLVGEASAVVWRAPQAVKALNQMLRDVAWGELDYLIIDMPPGTGDLHLSLVQQVPVNGAIIVTTPQEVALADARKSVDMFKKVDVPILGIIENMAGFAEPATGIIHAIFGKGGGKRLAEATSSPFLGSIPLEIQVRIAGDEGIAYDDKAGYYRDIVEKLVK